LICKPKKQTRNNSVSATKGKFYLHQRIEPGTWNSGSSPLNLAKI